MKKYIQIIDKEKWNGKSYETEDEAIAELTLDMELNKNKNESDIQGLIYVQSKELSISTSITETIIT